MIYMATPYSHPDVEIQEARFNRACKWAGHFMAKGEIIFSPIAHTHPIAVMADLPKGWDYWERFDREFITRCDEVRVMMMDGWNESRGVQAEIKIAKELGKPVVYAA